MQSTAEYCFEYQFTPNDDIGWLVVIFIDNIKNNRVADYEFFNANKLFIEVPADLKDKQVSFKEQVNRLIDYVLKFKGLDRHCVIAYGDENLEMESIQNMISIGPNNIHLLKKEILKSYLEIIYKRKCKNTLYIHENEERIEACLESNLEDIEVAFYIFKDGEKVEIRWYDEERYVSYTKQGEGIYKVVAFIRCKYGMLIEEQTVSVLDLQTTLRFKSLKQALAKKSIDIHGSCVSRDLFNFPCRKLSFSRTYCARTSVFACLSEPCQYMDKEFIQLESKFRRRSLEYDIDKAVFETLRQGKGNYIMIDLVDTVRFVLLKYRESIFTGSTEFMDSTLEQHYDFERINPLTLPEAQWKEQLNEYIEKIKAIYGENYMIIHCVYFKNRYVTERNRRRWFNRSTRKTNRMYNKALEKWYTYLKELLPNAIYIDICKQREYLADEKHHYGLAPVHYNDEYYLDVLKQLEEVLECNQ